MNPKPSFEIRYSAPGSATATQSRAKRYAINRLNAQNSTGPRTADGKARSAMNALSHGLTAVSPLLPSEDRAAYDRNLQCLLDEYKPKGATETILVREVADTAWRLKRIPALDDALAITEALRRQERLLTALSVHGNRLSRQLHATLDKLRHIQSERLQQERDQLRKAGAIYKVHKDKGLPYDPAEDGFVFSTQELDRYVNTQMRHQQAKFMDSDLTYGSQTMRVLAAMR
ncbi:MAG TPA: hypothetical protein VEU96_12020 [Bryobacteraceae bacterium]|nr:hypothetical protein [Bryobacteraceae bacterium]